MARLLIALGMRDAGGAVAVDARGGVSVATRTRRGAAGAATASSRAAGQRWVILLALGDPAGARWLVQVGLRLWFSRHQVMPLANPDETAYLVAARVLAGGPAADLSYSTLYPGGYPLLITPAYWFSSDPSTVYHAVMVVRGARVTEPEFNLGGGMTVDYTRPDAVFDWPGYGPELAGLAGLARPGGDAADRAGPRRHRLLRLVPDPGARREAQPR